MSDKKLHSDVHAGAGRFLVIFEECIAKDVSIEMNSNLKGF